MAGKESDIYPALDSVLLDGKSRKHVSRYSFGMKQRLAVARAILGDNDIIVLDEPFNGLDPANIYAFAFQHIS